MTACNGSSPERSDRKKVLDSCVSLPVPTGIFEPYAAGVSTAVEKVARHYRAARSAGHRHLEISA